MKAVEFIRKFGWNDARVCILNCASPADKWFIHCGVLISDKDFDDLKRLVESHELIASRGGLDAAKHELIALQKHLNNTFGWVTIITSEKIDRLKQAIADVESCQ